MAEVTGVWVFGAYGGLATTMMIGARAIARGLTADVGMVTARDVFSKLDLADLGDLHFGGHDIRQSTLAESARTIQRGTGSLSPDVLEGLDEDLEAISDRIRPGTTIGCGPAIDELATEGYADSSETLRAVTDRLRQDLREFRQSQELSRLVAINMTSTEPFAESPRAFESLAELEKAIDADDRHGITASLLYSYAAFQEGAAVINFTPAANALSSPLEELATDKGLPYMGSDGKTGETLVKSVLGPMFRDRHLKVLSWQGYNMLGDRDGQILSRAENKEAKVRSKDHLLSEILGYPLHTHVSIDYVPSLDDLKTAWDFIHFEGFLGFKMSLQFTWQGCDAILGAPLALDMIRMADVALRRGESGRMTWLASFFKSPLGVDEQDFNRQYQRLLDYLEGA